MKLPPNLFVALRLDYSLKELGYNFVVMLGDIKRMRLFRGRGQTEDEATLDALHEFEMEFPNG